MTEKSILNYLIEYLIFTLYEIQEANRGKDFVTNEYLAYIECLEIVSKWQSFKKFGIDDIEKHFQVK